MDGVNGRKGEKEEERGGEERRDESYGMV